jgi:hydroxymethylpyrimidine/phosphomethylpyrimidine kinase
MNTPTRVNAPVVVSFAAHDPTSGAGLPADLLTLSALGCQATGVLTGITAQDSHGVHAFEALSANWIKRQAEVLLADFSPRVFKSGALCSEQAVMALISVLDAHPSVPLVADPVLASGRGDALAGERFLHAYTAHLLPRVSVLTPNLPEALALSAQPVVDDAIAFFFAKGVKAVLLTGTHDESTGANVINRLYLSPQSARSYTCLRLPGHYHGSGCTLASALAGLLALDMPLEDAVDAAVRYTVSSLQKASQPGSGQAIPDRLLGKSISSPHF